MKDVVVEGCEFEIYESGNLNENGIVTVNSGSVVSDNTAVDGKGVYTTLKVDVSNFTSSVVTNWVATSGSTTTPAGVQIPGEIISSAQYGVVDSFPVILEGDQAASVTIYGKVQSGQTTIDATTVVSIKVKSAGQTVVQAE